jgi:aminotransferase in exopolysaccharide biosynthesis
MAKYQEIINKIREIFHKTEGQIILHEPLFIGNEKKYIEECIDSTYVSSVGKFVDLFEERMAEYTGAKKAVVCVNGTNALQLALLLVGVEKDDEVITQPLTFIATANAISYCGAYPVFVDVNMETMGLCPKALDEFLTQNAILKNEICYNIHSGRKIKACVPMHTFGHPCQMDELTAICEKFNIELVEDAAESLGSYYKGKHTGTFGKIGILSFNGNKVITTGGGGMLLFNDEELAKRAKHLTTQAKVPHRWEFVHDEIGYNYRMPNINAALGCAQLEQLDKFIANKRQTALSYKDFFSNYIGVTFFIEPKNCISNYWLNVIIFESQKERNLFLEESNSQGVMTRPIWQLMNRLPMFEKCQCGDLHNAEWLADRVVNIPSSVIK